MFLNVQAHYVTLARTLGSIVRNEDALKTLHVCTSRLPKHAHELSQIFYYPILTFVSPTLVILLHAVALILYFIVSSFIFFLIWAVRGLDLSLTENSKCLLYEYV